MSESIGARGAHLEPPESCVDGAVVYLPDDDRLTVADGVLGAAAVVIVGALAVVAPVVVAGAAAGTAAVTAAGLGVRAYVRRTGGGRDGEQ